MKPNRPERSLLDLFRARKSRSEAKKAPQSRALRLEGLEERQLLSVSVAEFDAIEQAIATSYETAFDLDQEFVEDHQICSSPVADRALETENIASLSSTINNLLREAGQDPNNISQNFVFNLSSNPSSTFTIFLDFDGNRYAGNRWTDGAGVVTPKFDRDGNVNSFSNSELCEIYNVWLRVSEDYAPFNVNVTTKDPGAAALTKSSSGDNGYGIRVAIGGSCDDWYGASAGGVAYVGSFDWNEDCPCFVFSEQCYSAKDVAEAAAHEVGHTLGLSHDGTSTEGYYRGANGWASIMGVGYYQPLTQWSKGEYPDANNREDDLSIITSKGFGYKSDDCGNAIANATALQFVSSGTLGRGLIERNTDVDFYSFELNGQRSVITVGGYSEITNLDALVKLYDASGNLIKVYDPTDALYVTIDVSDFAPGKYYMSVEGTGLTVDGNAVYSGYGSLGVYYITTALSVDYEPNESMETATDLGLISGTCSFAANINNSGDEDYYLFTIEGETNDNHYVRLNYEHGAGFDIDIELYNERGVEVGYSSRTSGEERITLNGKPSGDYYLYVHNCYSSGSAGYYSFEISAPETNAIRRPSLSVQVSGSTANLTIDASEGASKYVVQYGLDPDFNNFSQKTFDAAGTYPIPNLTRNENYYFRVKALSDDGRESRWRTTNALIAAPDRFESNDLWESARDLGTVSRKTTYNLNLGSSSDEDWIRFTIPANGGDENYVRLTYDPELIGGRIRFDLYEEYHNEQEDDYWQILSSEEPERGVETATLVNLLAGTYCLRVYNESENATGGFYSLEISPPAPLAANVLDRPVFYCSPNDTAAWVYLEPVENAQEYVLQYGTDPEFGSYSTISYLNYGEHTIKDLTPSTKYFFRVKVIATDYRDSAWSYGEMTTDDPYGYPDDPSLYDVYEPNNLFSTAYDLGTILGVANLTQPCLHSNNDYDWYKFTIAATGTSSSYVKVLYEHDDYIGIDINVNLYDSQRNQIISSLKKTGVENISLEALEPGDYYVQVYNWYYVDGLLVPYSLSISAPSANVLRRPVLTLASVGTNSLTLDIPEVVDAQKYVVQFGTDPEFESFSNVTFSTSGAQTIGNLSPQTLYYVRVKATATGVGDSAWTTLAVKTSDLFELNDDRDSAWDLGTLSGGSTLQASLHYSDDVDWFKFVFAAKGDANSFIRINNQVGDLDVDAKLYDSFGALVGLSTDQSGVEKISLNGKSAGTYYLRVYNAGATSGDSDYELFVSAPTPSAQRLSAPIVTASTTKNAAVLKITAVASASNYVVHYSEDPTFSTYSEKIYPTAGSKTISNLTSGTTYYFRAKAIADDYEDSEWTVLDATTKVEILAAPTLTANGKLGKLEVEIGEVANASGYVLEIDENSDFSSARQETYSEPGTKTIGDLVPGTTYYVRVKATSERCVDSAWRTSSATSFDYNPADLAILAELNCPWNDADAVVWNEEGRLEQLYIEGDGYAVNFNLTGLDALRSVFVNECDNSCKTLSVSNCPSLEWINCFGNSTTKISVSDCPNLQTLDCYSNELTELDVSNCANLQYLSCKHNELTELDVSNCANLQCLYCGDNELTELNVSDCPNLQTLDCYSNALTELDVSNCSNLQIIECCNNELTELDVSNYPNLQYLNCGSNFLTSLDASNCPSLQTLYCDGNELTELDVSNCPNLQDLDCGYNSLTSLDASNCPNLQTLYCGENAISALDLSDCVELRLLSIEDTNIKSLSLANNPRIESLFFDRNCNEIVLSRELETSLTVRIFKDSSWKSIEVGSGAANLTGLWDYSDLSALTFKSKNFGSHTVSYLKNGSVVGTTTFNFESEPNDAMETACDLGNIVGTKTVNSALSDSSDFDFYKFSIASPADNDYLKVTYDHATGFDVDITIYNSAGQYVSGSYGTSGVERVSLKGWKDGDYYVKVYNYGASSGVGGNYSLEICANEANALLSPSLSVQVAVPEVAVEIGAVEGASKYVLQYGTDREFNEFTQDTRAGAGTWALSGLTPNANYFFRVKSISDDGRESRWTLVDALIGNPDPFERNEDMDDAHDLGTLTEATSYRFNLDSSNDVDWFAFTTVANGGPEGSIRLVCDGAPENADLVFDLYYEYEGVYWNDDDDGEEDHLEYYTDYYGFYYNVKSISFENLPAGNYYLRVSNQSSDPVGALYSLEIVPPSPLASNELDRPCFATDMCYPYREEIELGWSVVPNAVNYVFEYGTDPDFATSTTLVYSALVDVEEANGDGLYFDCYCRCVKYLTPSTTYYFRVKATAPGYLDSQWTSVESLTTEGSLAGTLDRFEPNNEQYDLYDLGTLFGQNRFDATFHQNDYDYYGFSLAVQGTSGSNVQVIFDSSSSAYFSLYDADGQYLKSSQLTSDGVRTISLDGLAAGNYYIRVYGYYVGDYELVINVPSPANVLKRPLVSIPTRTTSSITLDVASVDNAQKYVVQYGTDPTFESYSNVSFSASGTRSIANLEVNTTYYFRVKATATGYSDSAWTTFTSVTGDAYESNDALETAFEFGELAGESTYAANISSRADKDYYMFTIGDEGKIDSYVAISFDYQSGYYQDLDIYLYDSTGALVALSTDDRYRWRVDEYYEAIPLYGIPAGTYYLFVESYQSSRYGGCVPYDLTISAPIPTPKLETPTFAATASTSTSITLNIGAVQSAESYVIEYSRNAKFQSSTVLTRSEPGAITVSGLTIGATYYFRVKTIADGYLDSEWTSISAKTQPSAGPRLATPTIGLSGTKTAIVVKIDAVEDAQKYVVQYSTDSSFATYVEKNYASAGTKTISGLPTLTGYFVRVKAIATGHDDSVYAMGRVYTSTDKCAVPTLKFSATKTAIVVNIGAVDKAEEYVVEYSVNSDFSNSTTRTFSGAGAKTISGLTFGTQYYVRVKARSSIANDSGWNDNNGKPFAAGQLAVPTFFASKVGSDFINVRCYNSANASGFEVMWSTSSDFSDAQFAQSAASSGIVEITGLTPETKYYYKVRALGDNVLRVDSSWSVIVGNATTKAAPPLPAPVAPSVSPTKTAVVVKLVAVENATNYVLEYGTDPTFTTFATKSYATVGAKTISGLAPATTYYFRLKATAVGYSDSEWTTFEALTLSGAASSLGTVPTKNAARGIGEIDGCKISDSNSAFENYFDDELEEFWDVLAESLRK